MGGVISLKYTKKNKIKLIKLKKNMTQKPCDLLLSRFFITFYNKDLIIMITVIYRIILMAAFHGYEITNYKIRTSFVSPNFSEWLRTGYNPISIGF